MRSSQLVAGRPSDAHLIHADHHTIQFLLLSIIGRTARIIQAHMCPQDQRLKVRYSQLFDFSHDTSVKKDLFLRWLLCDPVTETKPMSDGDDLPTSPAGDTAPQLTPFNATHSLRNTTCRQDTPQKSAALPTETPAPCHVVEQQTSQCRDSAPHIPSSAPTNSQPTTTRYDELSRDFAAISATAMVPVA
jgi:hypothetical protein